MEYYSIRVKLSAWKSDPLGLCTPLTVDKKNLCSHQQWNTKILAAEIYLSAQPEQI